MPDFSHLSKYAITEETTAEYVFTRIEGDPSVILAPAHEVNPAYIRARLAHNMKLAEKLGQQKGQLGVEDMLRRTEDEREVDRQLLAQTCVRRWGTAPRDKSGQEVEFSTENAYEFFKALPPEMFDPLRDFAGRLFNFYPERNLPLGEADGAALGN